MTETMRELPAAGPDGRARATALAQVEALSERIEPTSVVSYQSWGRLLVIGPEDAARSAARQVREELDCTLFVPGEDSPHPASLDGIPVIRGGKPVLKGRLGAFEAGTAAGTEDEPQSLSRTLDSLPEKFDLVLDLGEQPLLTQEIPPPGYYAPGDDEALARALEELPQMRGEFEKPKFFEFDPEICAHGRSGLKGCTRCIDACPTLAISSAGEVVHVDPFLCQGAGSCVAACPTGAMTYAFPGVDDLLGLLRDVLNSYREAGGEAPCLLFHDGWSRSAVLEGYGPAMPERVLPVQVEEVGSIGLEAWLASLAYGAAAVRLVVTRGTPERVLKELEEQIRFGRAILEAMGLSGESLGLVTAGEPADWDALPESAAGRPAKFSAPDDKRTILRLAIDHLHRHAPSAKRVAPLPAGAPFGEIKVDKDACTLSMSCVSVCPAAALQAGGDLPQLKFVEWNCVQCGLCEKACPEDAITLHPRILFDSEARQSARILHEEEPFCCIVCGKPFATQSVLDRMTAKLQGHWMFQSEDAMRRLQMCDTCRVKDMFQAERASGGPGTPS
ncbi:MAG: 4Fe-4S binding protein [Gammaproteobacteria bacterium]